MDADKNIENVMEIFNAIQNLPKGGSKIIKCPVCGGKMIVKKSSYNGHICAMCEKEDCMKMIQ